ncbi:MAG: tetratricopeptide repeat protein [bacterium]
MGGKFWDKFSKFFKKESVSNDSRMTLGKIVNTDISDLVGDIKASSLLSQIEKNPEKIEFHVSLAELYKCNKKYDKAVDVYLGIAQKCLELKNPSQTIYFINLGLQIMPDHGPLNMFSADMDIRMGRFTDAPSKYRKAANYFIKRNDSMTALYLFRRIKDMNKATVQDLLNMSGLFIKENLCEDALQTLLPLVDKLKEVTGIQSLKDKEACLMMIHSLKRDDINIVVELIETRIEMKEFDRAMVLLKRLISGDPQNINFLKRQAFLYKQLSDMENYIRTFRTIANIYAKEGNVVYRNIYFHKILKHLPNDVEALTALKMDDKLRENIDTKIENTDSKIKIIDQ